MEQMVQQDQQILHEERRRDDHLLAGIQKRLEDHVEGASRPAGHHDLVGRKRNPPGSAQRRRDCRPRLRITGIRHIHVLSGYLSCGELPEPFIEGLRRVEIRVAETEIKYLVRSVPLLEAHPLLKHFSDEGRLGDETTDLLCDCHRKHLSIQYRPVMAVRNGRIGKAFLHLTAAPPCQEKKLCCLPFNRPTVSRYRCRLMHSYYLILLDISQLFS